MCPNNLSHYIFTTCKKKEPWFLNIMSVSKNISKHKDTATTQLLQYACVNLQLARGVWNFVEETEELVNKVTAHTKFMKGFEHVLQIPHGRKETVGSTT
jgi:hypothetical protein